MTRVVHPSRADHPQHALAAAMMPRGTAMLTVELTGGDQRALAVLRELRLFSEATSLGGVESLASTPFNSSHFSLSAADRAAAGIGPANAPASGRPGGPGSAAGRPGRGLGRHPGDRMKVPVTAACDLPSGVECGPQEPQIEVRHLESGLAEAGVRGVALTWVDNAGITRVKAVPLARLGHGRGRGVGMSPVFDVFCADDSITTTRPVGGPVGDLRLHPDLDRLTCLWPAARLGLGPGGPLDPGGRAYPACQRPFASAWSRGRGGRG